MERTKETLEARVRETPLADRLKECQQRIGNMCAELRGPKMSIPVEYYDDDFYICTTLADAQATVEALQARVKELEAIKTPDDAFTYCAYCGEKSPVDEHNEDLSAHIKVCPKHPMRDAESQLTQRTAELEAAKGKLDIILRASRGEPDDELAVDYGGLGWENDPAVLGVYNMIAELERLRTQVTNTTERKTMTHPELVKTLAKTGEAIKESITPEEAHLLHMAIGVSGEAGEILDNIKKHVIYKKPFDRTNMVEELGDIEFYLEGIRQGAGITREECITHNIAKLSARYHKGSYSDTQAHERADKQDGQDH